MQTSRVRKVTLVRMNGFGIIQERLDNFIREMRENNHKVEAGLKRMEDAFVKHNEWAQEVVGRYESRMLRLEMKHEGIGSGHGLTSGLLSLFFGKK